MLEMQCEKTRQSSKRRVKKMRIEAEECARQTQAQDAMQEMETLTIERWTWSRWPCLRICRQSF
jgi:hypothetical protein